MSEIMSAIEQVAKSFEEMKKTNDAMLKEERAGNSARAAELKQALDKISDDLSTHAKAREIAERRHATMQERLEILEAVNSRPGKTAEDKIRSEHKDLFFRWVRSSGTDESALHEYKQLQQKARDLKAVSIGTDAAGGFGLPEEISRSIDNLVLKTSDIVANVKNVATGTSDYKELVSQNDAGSGWSTETGSRSATATPQLRNRVPTWGELYALPSATNWSLEDIFFNVETWLTDTVAEAWSVALSTAIYNGNGSGVPTGMFNATPVTTDDYASPERAHSTLEYIPLVSPSSPFTSTGVTADSLIALVYQLRRGYTNGAKFAMNRTTLGHVRRLKDTYGQYLWQPSFQAGQPDMILGYPVFVWEDLGNPTTGNAYPVVFGDFRRGYTLATRNGTSVLRDPYSTKGQTAFYIARRVGGIVTNNNALKVLKVSIS